MNDVNELLKAYKDLNETVAKSQLINEKIFKEMIMTKVRKSLDGIKLFDHFSSIIGLSFIPVIVFCIYKCKDRLDLLVMSILALCLVFTLLFITFKFYKWKISLPIMDESDMRKTFHSVIEATQTVRKKRILETVFAVPFYILIIPVVWYVFKSVDYREALPWWWQNKQWLVIYMCTSLALGILLGWKSYDWIYFRVFKKVEANLRQLDEVSEE